MKNYFSSHAVDYEAPSRAGYLSLPVLHFLWGQPWDQFALNFVHSFKPPCIRVVIDEEKTDAWQGRVTVYVRRDGRGVFIIKSIRQETSVGLDGDDPDESYQHGHALHLEARRRGINLDF